MKDYNSKKYKEKQKAFFDLIRKTYGAQFDEYITEYFAWKKSELYKGFTTITEKTDDSEAKAIANRYSGAINAVNDIEKRL